MKFEIRIDEGALEFLNSLDSESRRIVKNNLKKLKKEPYPSPENKIGDIEKVSVGGEEVYRMHISRSYTAFYIVDKESDQVVITDLMDIDTAHKRYD